jgi:hypothetical protein
VQGSIWVSAVFTFAGGILVLAVIIQTLRSAFRAASPQSWARHYARETYVSFAWRELGRGLFLGYLYTLGLSPVTAFFFLGQEAFWRSFLYLSLINWGLSAIAIYFALLLPGFHGYLKRRAQTQTHVPLLGQVLIVGAMSAPLAWAFFALLLPPAHEFFRILIETWLLYTRIILAP